MKRIILTYTTTPKTFKVFAQASEQHASDSIESEEGIIEYSIEKNPEQYTLSHYISFTDEQAQEIHKKTPRSQVFEKVVKAYCGQGATRIDLPDKGLAKGVVPASHEELHQEEKETSLYRNQKDIEKINSTNNN